MAKKLGETLVGKGILTREQLDQALRTQLIRGGHLGTCLTELGYTDERALGKVLSELLGLPLASAEMFARIPSDVLNLIDKEEAVRRQVIPVGLDGKSLHLAVMQPKHAAHLSRETGHRLVLYVAPETRILEALERYYGVPRRRRYIVPVTSEVEAPSSFVTSFERLEPAAGRRRIAVPATVSPGAKWLHALSRRMAQVTSHTELGDVLLDEALQGCSRRILFAVDGQAAEVANARGLDLGALKGLRFAIDESSLFALAGEDSYYQGPVPEDFDRLTFFGRLGLAPPREVLVMPIYGEERLEAVLYGDG